MPFEFGTATPDIDSGLMPAVSAPAPTDSRPSGNGGGGIRFVTDIIVERGFASRERVEEAILAARSAGITPEQLLVDEGAITPEQRGRAVADRLGLEFLDLSVYRVDMGAVGLLPAAVMTSGRSSSRWPIPQTSSPSTTWRSRRG
jgi:hypothetical protein